VARSNQHGKPVLATPHMGRYKQQCRQTR